MSFNPDPTIQAQEVIFSRKAKQIYHSPLVFNDSSVFHPSSQKQLAVILDTKLIFGEHLKMVIFKNKLNLRTFPKITKPATKVHANYNI